MTCMAITRPELSEVFTYLRNEATRRNGGVLRRGEWQECLHQAQEFGRPCWLESGIPIMYGDAASDTYITV